MKRGNWSVVITTILVISILLLALSACATENKSAYDIAKEMGYQGNESDWISTLGGKSAYDLAVECGYTGTLSEWLNSLNGERGLTAYEQAVEWGYNGTIEEWLASFDGKSAYDLAVEGGFNGTQEQWEQSLKGDKGDSAYQIAVKYGYDGDENSWLKSLNGLRGYSAYELAKIYGYNGSESEWLNSLHGKAGKSAYELAVENGFDGTLAEWVDLKCPQGNPYSLEFATNESLKSSVFVYGAYAGGSKQSSGSGVIYSLDKKTGQAYILTCYHVLFNKLTKDIYKEIYIALYGRNDDLIQADFIGGSRLKDIAIIRVSSENLKSSVYQSIRLGDDSSTRIGMDIIATGNSQDAGISVSRGIVSALNRTTTLSDVFGEYINVRTHRIDAVIDVGNSGGGAFDYSGKFMGMTAFKDSDTPSVAYIVPSSLCKIIAEQVIGKYEKGESTKITKANHGLTFDDSESSAEIDDNGNIYIKYKLIIKTTDASGFLVPYLKPNNQITAISIDNVKYQLNSVWEFEELMLTLSVGDSIGVYYTSNGNSYFTIIKVTTTSEIK